MPVVALDTSALMMPVELDLRVFDELDRVIGDADLVVPQPVLEELRGLAEGAGTEGRAARVGLDLARKRCGVVDTDAAAADDALTELAVEQRIDYVVTNDLPLRDRVLDAAVPVIGARGRNTLAITEP